MDDLVTRFLVFKLLLGMIRPRRIDDVWDPKLLSYNRHLVQLLTRREYYTLNRLLRPAIDALLETCNTTWKSCGCGVKWWQGMSQSVDTPGSMPVPSACSSHENPTAPA